MGSNMLVLPFRRTHTISLSNAIQQYISTKYDQHPSMFARDLEAIDEMRAAAANVQEPHVSGVRKLQIYAAQLVWLGGKFPVDIGVDFTWYPALGYNTQRPISQNNLRFELANVLYNLAALYSQLAMSLNRTTAEGLKTASNYFCFSAGVISHLKANVIPELRATPPEDMDDMTLESIEQLLLAQAQECFWQKAVKDGLKDASIAKLAAKVSDYYSDAGDHAIKSDAVSSEWIHHMHAKHHHFAAAAQYRAACDCLEKRKYGEEVARLQDSLNCVNEALKESRYLNRVVLGDLNGLKNRVQDNLKRSEKDNDMIYLLPVPPKSELQILDRANMVAAKVPKEVSESSSMLGDQGELGRPLFSKLVPYSVHLAASIYADRRDRLVNHGIIEKLDSMTAKIHTVLSSLNLPGSLQALEKPLGLPPGLVSHAEEIRQQGGMDLLYRTLQDTERIKDSDRAVYQEGVDILRAEAFEDEQARRRYGTQRWARPTSEDAVPKLHAQVRDIEQYFVSAESSDQMIRSKIKENEHGIALLCGSDRDLEEAVPSSRSMSITPKVEKEASRLRECLNDVSRIESRRRRKIEALRVKAKQDDINPDLLKEAARLEREYPMHTIEATQFEDFFDNRLHRYDSDQEMVTEEQKKQEELLSRLREANTAFVQAKRGDQSSKRREDALQSLENAYYKYKEVISNLDVGRKFYNDLAKIVGRFRDDCRNFAYHRRAEASQLESDMLQSLSSLSLQQPNALQQHQQHQQQHQQGHAETYVRNYDARPPENIHRPTGNPTAPVPGTWMPQMDISFAKVTTPNSKPTVQAKDARWDPSKGLKFG